MMSVLRPGAAILLAAGLAGCASVENCDPNSVGNVVTSALCDSGGYYAQRQGNLTANYDRISAEVERERIAISRANSRIREAQAAQQITAAEARTLNGQIAALNSDVNRLAKTSDPTQQAALRQQIDQRKNAINDYSDITVF
ncbi:MAG: hypothetical protein KDA73_05650 [Rhodobacteraceae bacterium]|nr:hypothetical protein [Paracoccaceae bacterium]